MGYTVTKLTDRFYAIDQDFVRCFLFVGDDKAVLVDTGIGGALKDVIQTVTDKPVTLITTHFDGDHTGCDGDFSPQYLHTSELSTYEKRKNADIAPDLGGRMHCCGRILP